ncbi:MAG: MarR family winged helix-turn-helix transcriptional regulator [Vicinamibacterales bacterium]
MGDALKRRIRQTRFDGPAHEAVLNLLIAAGFIRQFVEEACAAADITYGQYNALRILRSAHPKGHPRGEIAARLVERAPDVTRLIDRLERRGLVERSHVSEDRRLSLTRITRPGMDVLRRVEPRIQEIYRQFAARVPQRDLRELSRICETVYDTE